MLDHRGEPLVELPAEHLNLFRIGRDFLLAPAVGHRLQQRQQRHRRRHDDAEVRGLLEERIVTLEGRAEKRFERQEHHHELRRRLKLLPVFLRAERSEVIAKLPGVRVQRLERASHRPSR